jgi:ketosteroid isomerase-like protein
MNERSAVIAANDAFYRAVESLDLTRMEVVWLHAASISCVHPGWRLLTGWGPVMESWQRIFANTLAMDFTITDARAEVVGDVAWVVCVENLESAHRDQTATAQLQATNIFRRHDGQWWLVHHHASPISPQLAEAEPEHMH